MRRKYRRKNRRKKLIPIICAILLILILVWLVCKLFPASKPDSRNETTEAITTMEVTSMADTEPELPTATIPAELPTETEAEPETETEPQYLAGIKSLSAGTVLEPGQIDSDDLGRYFSASGIEKDGSVYQRIAGKSYRQNDNISLDDLRYLKVLHYNFDHNPQVGELIVNQSVADQMLEIFRELYEAEYEVKSMHLIDDYWTGDGETSDSASIDVNNTSAFCYREVGGSTKLSNHAYGLAIDLNPQQNPYVKTKADGSKYWEHKNANDYIDRSSGRSHVITHEDLAYQLFTERGFQWGGDWNNPKDYQHFEVKR